MVYKRSKGEKQQWCVYKYMYIGVWYVYDYDDSLGICRSRRIKETEKPGERQRNKEPSPLLPLTRTRMRQRPGPSPGRPLLQQVVTDIVGNHRRQRVQGFSRFDAEKPPNLTDYIIGANKTEMTYPKKKKKKHENWTPRPRWRTHAERLSHAALDCRWPFRWPTHDRMKNV